MIYTVELNFAAPERADDWNAWYEGYLRQLVSLDGLDTAQRFQAVDPEAQDWAYLALYSLPSLAVYDTEAYRAIGGGGNASREYHAWITRRRNVYEGIRRLPEVTGATRVVFADRPAEAFDIPDLLLLPLTAATGPRQAGATSIDGEPATRAIALAPAAVADPLARTDGLAVYAPITKRYD